VFIASIANIEKALRLKSITEPYTKLLKHYSEFLDVFNYIEANKLLLLYRLGVDYYIKL
jgi:hypothetical protein